MRRAGLAERIDTVERRMDSMEQRLDASFDALTAQILQSSHETRNAVLATLRGEMVTQGEVLRGELRAQGTELRGEMKVQGETLRGEMKAQTTALRDEMRAQATDLLRAIKEGDEETRRYMLILHEETLSRIALIGEGGRPPA